eukprot:5774324-Amphidinium_carterae.1
MALQCLMSISKSLAVATMSPGTLLQIDLYLSNADDSCTALEERPHAKALGIRWCEIPSGFNVAYPGVRVHLRGTVHAMPSDGQMPPTTRIISICFQTSLHAY